MRSKTYGILAVSVFVMLALTSCGGGAGADGETNYNPSTFNSEYVRIDLATNTARAETSFNGKGGTKEIVLKRTGYGFYAAVTEVTKGQWETIMGSQPWSSVSQAILRDATNTSSSNLPACNLTRDEASAFATALAGRTGLKLSLPTEAQYRSILAGKPYAWGSDGAYATAATYATLLETNDQPTMGPTEVGRRSASNGLWDLYGNVREWTKEGTLFGGGWSDNVRVVALSPFVSSVDPSIQHPLSGFRIVAIP